jgi:hypothetical protein
MFARLPKPLTAPCASGALPGAGVGALSKPNKALMGTRQSLTALMLVKLRVLQKQREWCGKAVSNTNDAGSLAFGLRSCRDLLVKLRCEMGDISSTERFNVMGRLYIAFNCVVTAWHMTDWVWVELDQEKRERVQTCAGTKYKLLTTDPRPLQEFARRHSPALKLCELLANGSKHCSLRNRNPHVSTKMTDGEGVDYGNPVVIVDGKETWVGDVLCQAALWWETFLTDWHVAEEPPFILGTDF